MKDIVRYAVFGLLDEEATCRVGALQQQLTELTANRTALFFPAHITIRGRFWASDRSVNGVLRHLRESGSYASGPFQLIGPVFRPPDLLWLELSAATLGFRELSRMHRDVSALFRSIVQRDEVPADHAGEGFQPHVTLGWGCSPVDVGELEVSSLPISLSAEVASLALVKYPGEWPVTECLEIIETAPV
jgi:hypothetical protein